MDKNKFSIIFGLTADPIHKGHEQVIINGVEFCRDNDIEIERFLLIPVYQPNLIADKKSPVACFEHRFHMCELVADKLSNQLDCDIQVSRIEEKLVIETSVKNYSYNTIRALHVDSSDLREWIPASAGMTDGGTEIERKMECEGGCLFMVSADHFQGRWPKFRKWYKWREMLKLSGLLINQRPGNTINQGFIQQLNQINKNVFIVKNKKKLDISSSQIRTGKWQTNLELLSEDVAIYVGKNNLYK